MLRRLFAESSSVLSNHWVAEVIAGFSASTITYLDRDAIRSLLIGFLLYAIAEEPIWFFSNGSSTSFRCCRRRISLDILCALAAIPARTFSNSGIHFTGIGLSGYRIAVLESHLLCDHRINLVDRLLISVKQFQESLPVYRSFPWNREVSECSCT